MSYFCVNFVCMKKVILLILVISGYNCYAQLFVGSNSYMYVGNQFVYVNGGVNLQEDMTLPIDNGRLFLRREGQLLQGTTSISTNSGSGKLSVYQEGTSNNFGYNYWCSPIGNTIAGVGNESFGISLLNQPVSVTESNQAMILPLNVSNGIANPLSIASYWIYKFTPIINGALVYADWIPVGSANSINAGEGFTMKGTMGSDGYNPGGVELSANNPYNASPFVPSAQRYDFRGKPNDGNIGIDVADGKLTLTGNPYSSAINLNIFLLENSGYSIATDGSISGPNIANAVINGEAFFWEHIKPATTHVLLGYVGGYGTYVANNVNAFSPGTYNNATWNTYNIDGSLNTIGGGAGTERYKRMFTPIGQGFFVEGFGTTGNQALMKNKYRVFVKEGVSNNSQFERNSLSDNHVGNWGEIPNVAGVDYTQFSKGLLPQIKVHTIINNSYTKEVTVAFNPNSTDSYDLAMEATSNEDLSSDVYLSINGHAKPFVINTLPFEINKRIPFSIKSGSAMTTFKITIGDIINFNELENVYIYDSLTDVYHDVKNNFFEISLPQGIYENRFEITFLSQSLSNTNSNIRNSVTVYQNNLSQNLTILNPYLLELKEINLFDLTGKRILERNKPNIEAEYRLSTSGLSQAVYIVKIKTDKGEYSQKIIVSNEN